MIAVLAAGVLFIGCKNNNEIDKPDAKAVATLTSDELINAVAAMYAQWEEDTTIPETLTVGSVELTLPQYQYAMCKLIDNLAKGDKSKVDVLNYKAADHPERDSYDEDEIAVVNGPANNSETEDLGNIAKRMMEAMNTKAQVPNQTLFYRGSDAIAFSTNRATVTMARAIAAYKADGKFRQRFPPSTCQLLRPLWASPRNSSRSWMSGRTISEPSSPTVPTAWTARSLGWMCIISPHRP